MTYDPHAQGSRDPTSGWTVDRASGAQPPSGVSTHGHKGGDIDSGTITSRELAAAVANLLVPVGVINPYYGTTPPTGWLLCDGSSFSATTYPALNTLLGTNVTPNLKGKALVGVDAAQTEFAALGTTGGAKTVTIASGNLPTHTHGLNSHNHFGSTQAENSHVHNHDHGLANHTHGGGTGVHAHNFAGGAFGTTNTAHTHYIGGAPGEAGTAPQGAGRAASTATTDSVGVGNTAQGSSDATAGTVHSHPIFGDAGSTTDGGFANTAVNKLPPYTCINYIIKAA